MRQGICVLSRLVIHAARVVRSSNAGVEVKSQIDAPVCVAGVVSRVSTNGSCIPPLALVSSCFASCGACMHSCVMHAQ
jgi:hypothetical protein